jgi:hypothetical protein
MRLKRRLARVASDPRAFQHSLRVDEVEGHPKDHAGDPHRRTLSGPLHLQKNGLGTLELMADKIVIDEKGNLALREGNIEVQKGKFIGNDKIRGVITLPSGQHAVRVKQEWDTAPTSITATTTYDAHLWIEDLTQDGFIAHVNPSATSEAKIYWSAIW